MNERLKGLLICFWVYLIAFVVAIYAANQIIGAHQWVVVSFAHFVSTCIVYIGSFVYKNSSLYDPFWSFAPAPIAVYVALWPESGVVDYEKILLVLIPVIFWSFRLNLNWIRKWPGLIEEDFRYVNLKKGSRLWVNFVDFFGIGPSVLLPPSIKLRLFLNRLFFFHRRFHHFNLHGFPIPF